MKDNMGDSLGLYVHIPFCKSKCNYCDFNSYSAKEALIHDYFNALEEELKNFSLNLLKPNVDTVFIGGGTPSYVDSAYISNVLDRCRKHFNIHDKAEVTIEANPGTLNTVKLKDYAENGINRISIGLQDSNNNILKTLGRIHFFEDFVESYKSVIQTGFNNINIDLIFGVPGQTIESWRETLERIITLKPQHISCYGLKIEEGTAFDKMRQAKLITPVDDEIDREMYWMTVEMLCDNGYRHYEISNFALEGYECSHNMKYWKAQEYIGAGAGAHSYILGNRFSNVSDLDRYIKLMQEGNSSIDEKLVIDKKESMSEYMMLGLRLIDGVNLKEFEKRYAINATGEYKNILNKLLEKKLILLDPESIRLSRHGLDFANVVFEEFV